MSWINLKKKLKYGIYHIKITCDNKNFKKIFSFSSDNHYTHYSVNFCLKYNINDNKLLFKTKKVKSRDNS